MFNPVFLRGPKVELKKFTSTFLNEKYIGWLNDEEITKYLYVGSFPVTEVDLDSRNNHHNIMFAILSQSTFIGTVTLGSINWIHRKAELGYMIGDQNFWGRGIATEVVELVAQYGLNTLNLHKIEAGVVEGNIGSVRALEKNGFVKYCERPDDFFVNGKFLNTNMFYKLQE